MLANQSKVPVLFILLYAFISDAFSQQNRFNDSLFGLIKKEKKAENNILFYNQISDEFRSTGQMDSCLKYGLISYKLAKKHIEKFPCNEKHLDKYSALSNVCGSLGIYHNITGNFPKALEYYFEALKIDEKTKNTKGQAARFGNIGNIYLVKAEYKKALDYYFKSLKIALQVKDTVRMGIQYGNIGIVYDEQATQANKLNAGSGDSLYDKALDYYFKALNISQKQNIKNSSAIYLGNIGTVYEKRQENEKALDYFFKALALAKELDDKAGSTIHLGNIGSAYMSSGKFNEAENYLNQALEVSKEIDAINDQRLIEELLSELYLKTKKFELSLQHYKASMALKDTIFNQEKENEATRKELNYEFEKKEAVAKANQEKKDAIKESEARRQKVILWSVAGGLVLVLIFAVFVFRSLRITHKQKRMIEDQKLMVEEKQKEIIDSIKYARRIQLALLATETKIEKEITRLNQN